MSYTTEDAGKHSSRPSTSTVQAAEERVSKVSIADLLKSERRKLERNRRSLKRQYYRLNLLILEEYNTDPSIHQTVLDIIKGESKDAVGLASNPSNNYISPSDPGFIAVLSTLRKITHKSDRHIDERIDAVKSLALEIKESEVAISKYHMLMDSGEDEIDSAIDGDTESLISNIRTEDEIKHDLNRIKILGRSVFTMFKLLDELMGDPANTDKDTALRRASVQEDNILFVKELKNAISIIKSLPDDFICSTDPKVSGYLTSITAREGTRQMSFEDKDWAYNALYPLLISIGKCIGDLNKEAAGEVGVKNKAIKSAAEDLVDQAEKGMVPVDNESLKVAYDRQKALKDKVDEEKTHIERFMSMVRDKWEEDGPEGGTDWVEELISNFANKTGANIKASRLRKFVRNMLYRGVPEKPDKSTKEILDNSIREYVRGLYGGNLPFEDEEEVISDNGSVVFMQRKYLRRKPNGEWEPKAAFASSLACKLKGQSAV